MNDFFTRNLKRYIKVTITKAILETHLSSGYSEDKAVETNTET